MVVSAGLRATADGSERATEDGEVKTESKPKFGGPQDQTGRRQQAGERAADAVVGASGFERGPGREGHGSRADAVVAGGRDEDRARRHEPEATAREDGHEVADAPGQNRRRTQAWTW